LFVVLAGAIAVVVVVATGSPIAREKVVDIAARTTSSMAPPPGFTHRVFEDAFPGGELNRRKWHTYITSRSAHGHPWNPNGSGGSGAVPGGFNAAYFQKHQVAVANGLTLTALHQSTRSGIPWTSGVVSTYGKFQFDGGYVQIKAKVPIGDGLWPGFWMLPGPGGKHGDDFELDIFEGDYTGNEVNPIDNYAWNLHTPSGAQFGGLTSTGVDLGAGYHIYGIDWVPGQSITWYLDGKPVGMLTSAQAPSPDEPMELILDLDVASPTTAGWHTVYDATTPSPAVLDVAEVQVYRARSDSQAAG
jgi:beta-glucanase (GH16 family)